MPRHPMFTGPAVKLAKPILGRAPSGADSAARLVDSIQLKLGSVVAFDWLCVGFTDPASGLITTMFSPEQDAMRFGCPDPGVFIPHVGGVPAAVRQRDPIAVLSGAADNELGYSQKYRDFLRLNAIGHEMRATLAVGDMCWGFLILQRGEDRRDFSARDVARVRAKLPGLAEELWRGLLGTAVAGAGQEPPGVVVVGSTNTMRAVSSQARTLIERTPAFRPLVPDGVPVPIAVLVEQLRKSAVPDGRRFLVPGSGDRGWFVVSGSRVDTEGGDREFVVSLEAAGPADLTPLILRAWGLTRRESAVALQVIKGLSTVEVAESLGISRHTVQDHLKAVFTKTGVRSRRDLARRVAQDPARWN